MKSIKKYINKIFWGFLFFAALGGLFYMLAGNFLSKNNQRYYMQGLEFINKKDYQNAYFNFSSVERGNEFYCPSKYRAALAAQNLYDKASATKMHKDVIDNCSGSLFEANSRYSLAKLYFEQKDFKHARNLFESIEKSSAIEKYQIAASYFLGEIEAQKNPKRAKSEYLKYLENAPDGKYAKEAISGLKSLQQPLNTDENYILGVALFKNASYNEAKQHLLLVPLERSWFYLAMCARKEKDYPKAKDYITKGLSEHSKTVKEDELHEAIDFYALLAPDKKTGYLNAVNILLPKSAPGGDYALYKYIDKLSSKERMPYYHRIADVYPNGKFASDAQWNIIHSQYKRGNYKKVIALADEHSKKHSKTIAAPRVLFFAGKSAEKLGQFSKAKGYYGKVLDNYPDDYYAFRSKLLLNGRKTAWTFKDKRQIHTHNKKIGFPLKYCKISQKDLATLDLLVKAEDWNLLEDLLGDNLIVKSWVNYKHGNKALSIVQARDFIANMDEKPPLTDNSYKLAYPLYFVEEINKHSINNDLDPYIVLAIIREESHFDTSAQSYVGAGGLMQVMPDTARFIAEKYNLSYNEYLRNNVDKNIELGCAYLDFALSQLSKKYLFAVAGYNGGHNAVKNWHKTLNYTDFDEFVEEIPYSETQTYIRKVFKSYWNYLNIYDRID